jgi:hypothetical protein
MRSEYRDRRQAAKDARKQTQEKQHSAKLLPRTKQKKRGKTNVARPQLPMGKKAGAIENEEIKQKWRPLNLIKPSPSVLILHC